MEHENLESFHFSGPAQYQNPRGDRLSSRLVNSNVSNTPATSPLPKSPSPLSRRKLKQIERDNRGIWLTGPLLDQPPVISHKDYTPTRASGRNHACYDTCEWCEEFFCDGHLRSSTPCCDARIGDTCVSEAFSQDGCCWNCRAPPRQPTPPVSKPLTAHTPANELQGNATQDCKWCGEAFGRGHWQMKTPCCGLSVGDSCTEEAFDQDNCCWNCSSPRRPEPPPTSMVSESPEHIRRFTNMPENVKVSTMTAENLGRLPRDMSGGVEKADRGPNIGASTSSTPYSLKGSLSTPESVECGCFPHLTKSLTGRNHHAVDCVFFHHYPIITSEGPWSDENVAWPLAEAAPKVDQAQGLKKTREHIEFALKVFILFWNRDAAKLPKETRIELIERSQKAFAGTYCRLAL